MNKISYEDLKPSTTSLDGIFRGVVEDRNDPLKAGRCRIRVFGVHTDKKIKDEYEGIPTDELPWAEPALGITEGSVSGFGLWSVPLQGSHVFLFFENKNIMAPRYFASIPAIPTEKPNIEEGFNDPNNEYPNTESSEPTKPNALNEPDYHRLARGITDNTPISYREKNKDTGISKADEGSWDEPDPYYETEYPNNIVFATHSGLTIEIDSTSGNERYHIFHPSNTFIEVDNEGNVIIKNARNKYEIIGNDKNIYIKTNHNITVDGNRTDYVKDKETKKIDGDYEVTIGGKCNINVTGDCNIKSSSTVTIEGSIVHINP